MNDQSKKTCLACGSRQTTDLYWVKSPILENREFLLHECGNCRSRFFDPEEHDISIPEENAKFSLSEHYLSAEFVPNPYWLHQVKMIRKLSSRPIRRILDCGCRTGDFLMHWESTIDRTGVEVVPEVAAAARRRGIAVINESLEQTKITKRYDVVTCYAILEHLTRPDAVLQALCEAVEDGGLLVIMVPSFQTLKARLLEAVRMHWHQLYPPFHLGYFSREFLTDATTRRGFEHITSVYTSGGMFNPLDGVPVVGAVWARGMNFIDQHSPSRFLPIFDHMYMYFRRTS